MLFPRRSEKGGGKSLLCDPGSELRPWQGGSRIRTTTIMDGMERRAKSFNAPLKNCTHFMGTKYLELDGDTFSYQEKGWGLWNVNYFLARRLTVCIVYQGTPRCTGQPDAKPNKRRLGVRLQQYSGATLVLTPLDHLLHLEDFENPKIYTWYSEHCTFSTCFRVLQTQSPTESGSLFPE